MPGHIDLPPRGRFSVKKSKSPMEALLKAQQHTEPIARMEAQHARTDAAALRLGSTPVFDREAVPVRISAYSDV